MDRKIENVRGIKIDDDDITIYYGNEHEIFKREHWKLVAKNISRLASGVGTDEEARMRFAKTSIDFDSFSVISCQILEDERTVLCGERPEKMFIG